MGTLLLYLTIVTGPAQEGETLLWKNNLHVLLQLIWFGRAHSPLQQQEAGMQQIKPVQHYHEASTSDPNTNPAWPL